MTYLVRYTPFALLAALLCCLAGPTPAESNVARFPPRQIGIDNTWKGSVPDVELLKTAPAPAYIANAKALEALWKAWKLEGKPPEVDFKTQILIVGTTRGSVLQPYSHVTEQGGLTLDWEGTDDKRPGFRYAIVSVKKEGVYSVNGAALKD